MKTVFIFNDSRVTDIDYPVFALSEDGVAAACIRFDDWTLPHVRFAMCVDEDSHASGNLLDTVSDTRAEVYAAFNLLYGSGNWRAVWVDEPKRDPLCLDALRTLHATHAALIEKRNAELVESVFSSFGLQQETQSHVTH